MTIDRSTSLAKLAQGLRLVQQAEAELRKAEEEERGETRDDGPVKVTEMDRARARRALERLGRSVRR